MKLQQRRYNTNLIDVRVAGFLVVSVWSHGEAIVRPVRVVVREPPRSSPRIGGVYQAGRGAVHPNDQLSLARQFTLVLPLVRELAPAVTLCPYFCFLLHFKHFSELHVNSDDISGIFSAFTFLVHIIHS